MLNLLQPKFFIPMHGEYQNLVRHAELAESVGIPSDNIKVAEDGELIRLTPETCEVFGREGRSGRVLVDGKPKLNLRISSYATASNFRRRASSSLLLSCTATRVIAISNQQPAVSKRTLGQTKHQQLPTAKSRQPIATLKQHSTLDK